MCSHLRVALLAHENAISLPHETTAHEPGASPRNFPVFMPKKRSVEYDELSNAQ
jgi:hypothetical protein